MRKNVVIALVLSIIILIILLSGGCSGASVPADPFLVSISEVSPGNRDQDIPLRSIISWKNPVRDMQELTCRFFWKTGQNPYSSELAEKQNGFFYFKPSTPFLPDQLYFWYVEFYTDGELTGRSKIYSFHTQETDTFRFSFFCHVDNPQEPNIWMGVPKVWTDESNDYVSITNISFSPEVADLYTDETGNRIVMWDTVETPASIYKIRADIEYVELQLSPVLNQELLFDYTTDNELYLNYTAPSEMHPSEHPDIINQAITITDEIENPYQKVIALNEWVRENVEPGTCELNALNVLHTKQSDCGGYASLNVAFCRALGYPSRMVTGIHSMRPNFITGVFAWSMNNPQIGTHGWYEVFFVKYGWIQFDSTGNLYPNDSRLSLAKDLIHINDDIYHVLHLPMAGKAGEYAYQEYAIMLKVEKIR